jgi:hypothetical protein
MEYKLNLSSDENKDLISFCNLNDLRISEVVKKSYLEGFNIERYGLLNVGGTQEKQVVKEVIVEKRVEIPVETIKEVVKVEYVEVPVEKIVEVIKEVPIERVVEKIVEVIKEIPIERVVEKIVEVIKEIPVEKVVIQEVVKEVPVEKIVEKIVKVSDDTQVNELLLKIQQLENTPPKVVEIIKEIPVDKVVIQEKIIEVIKEVPVEVIKEIVIEKEGDSNLKPKLDALQLTVQKLKQDNIEKDKLIREYEKTIEDIQKFQGETKAMYLKGSNLDDKLYK